MELSAKSYANHLKNPPKFEKKEKRKLNNSNVTYNIELTHTANNAPRN